MGDLAHVTRMPEYRAANAGLRHDFQLVNVDDFNGAGETEPSPYFYQVRYYLLCLIYGMHLETLRDAPSGLAKLEHYFFFRRRCLHS